MAYSKLTSKFQVTIPQKVRQVLKLKAGDEIIFNISDTKEVTIKKTQLLDKEYLRLVQSTLDEWSSKNDAEDYND